MSFYTCNNRKNITIIGLVLLVIGIVFAYIKWGVEPEETIAGVFCGLGFGMSVFGLGIQKPKN